MQKCQLNKLSAANVLPLLSRHYCETVLVMCDRRSESHSMRAAMTTTDMLDRHSSLTSRLLCYYYDRTFRTDNNVG